MLFLKKWLIKREYGYAVKESLGESLWASWYHKNTELHASRNESYEPSELNDWDIIISIFLNAPLEIYKNSEKRLW